MPANPPLIDVVIPVYNSERYIEDAIRSVLAQTEPSLRIIVVDDGSTDRSAEIVRSLCDADPRIVLLSKPNSGTVDALNMGLEHASAEFIARLDSDDICDPDRFEVQLRYLRDNPDCVAVSSNARLIDHNGAAMAGATNFGNLERADPRHVPSIEPNISHPFLFLRRDAIEQIGRYRHIFYAEDVDLYWRLQHVGRIHGLQAIHGAYRVHGGSLTGASTLNSRIVSVDAQLSAISEQRRRDGRPDIELPGSRLKALRHVGTLEGIVGLSSAGLSEAEADYLAVASSAKLLDWVKVRGIELFREDCQFISRAVTRHSGLMSKENRDIVRYLQIWALLRLMRQRHYMAALALIDVALAANIGARIAARVRRKAA